MRTKRDLVIEENIRILVALVAGKSRGDQAFLQLRGFRNVYRLAIQLRALARFSNEQLVPGRVIHDSGNALSFCARSMLQRHRDGKDRKPVSEIRSAVQ